MMKFFPIAFFALALFVFDCIENARADPPPSPAPVSVLCNTCTTTLSVSNATARVPLPSSAAAYNAITIYNSGQKDAYFAQGGSSVTATTSNDLIRAGMHKTVWVSGTYVAAVTSGSDTTTLDIDQGNGPFDIGAGSPAQSGSGPATANQGTPNAGGGQAWPVIGVPSSASGSAILTVSSTTVETNHTFCSAACNLFSINIQNCGNNNWAMLFDATALPVNGAVTPAAYWQLSGTGATISWQYPTRMSTGATVACSTTGPLNLTASNAEFGAQKQ